MNPVRPQIIAFGGACLLAVLFCSGCASLPSPPMEEQMLHQCIIRSDCEGALKIISSGVLDSRIDSDALGLTALFLAAQKNDTNVVQALLVKGANPNFDIKSVREGNETGTPVHAAATKRSAEALKMLLAHGGNALSRAGFLNWTPFEMSVLEVEPPGPVTDMLIQAGAAPIDRKIDKPRGMLLDLMTGAGTHWAFASYMDRCGNIVAAIQHYERAAVWYRAASEKALGNVRFQNFMNTPFMRGFMVVGALATGAAAQSQGTTIIWGDPNPITTPLNPDFAKSVKNSAASLKDAGERYAAYSKLCADRAAELKRSPGSGGKPDGVK